MITSRLRQFTRIAIGAGAGFIATIPASVASAADASPWAEDSRSAMRLIAGTRKSESPDGIIRAGIEIGLKPGWKTYWRYPGDSGVPPRFDFTQSENLKSATVRWPAPERFTDDVGNSIGYHDRVIFPLVVVPQDPAKPVRIRLKLEYAVCEKLCVPAKGAAELALTGGASSHDAALAAAEARVPKPAMLGDKAAFAIRHVRREAAANPPRIVVDVAAPGQITVALFAEGPTPDWALPLPEPVAGSPAGMRRFAFALDGLPPNTKPDGATLTLTAIAGEQAIEVAFRLD